MDAWLALDPETERIVIQNREFDDGGFPRGTRGLGWPVKKIEILEDNFNDILSGKLGQEFLRELWGEA